MPLPPTWLREFANAVAGTIQPVDVLAPLGCHFHRDGDVWEVSLFASSTEIVGGQQDGNVRPSRFAVDLAALTGVFEQVQTFHWQVMAANRWDELGAHVSLEGRYQGHAIWLRILSRAPQRFQPGRQARVYDLSWEEVW